MHALRFALAALAAAALAACDRAPAAGDAAAPSPAEAPFVGVWLPADSEVPFSFALLPGGVLYMPDWNAGLVRGQWRSEGQRVLMGVEYEGRQITFAAQSDADRISGELPDSGDRFVAQRAGVWASVHATNPAAGAWSVRMGGDDEEHAPCGLILQPDSRAFLSCGGYALEPGTWRADNGNVQIDIDVQFMDEGPDQIVLTGSLNGGAITGAYTYSEDGAEQGRGAFTATRLQ